MKIKSFLVLILAIFIFSSCTESKTQNLGKASSPVSQAWSAFKDASLLIDVRSPEEFASGHLEGAINIPHDQIEKRLSEVEKWKNSEVVVYCKSGRRAGIAQTALLQNGFRSVTNAGGYADLVAGR